MSRKRSLTPPSHEISSKTSRDVPVGDRPTPSGEQDFWLLSAIVNAADDAIISKTLDGIITTWNPAAERMFGYTAEEIIGKPKSLLVPPDRLQEEEVILERLQRGIPTSQFETIKLHRDGIPIHVSVTISPIKDGGGRVIGASMIARDITAHRQADQALQSNEDHLRADHAIGSRGTVTDVTERVKALQEQTKFDSLIENSSDFIAMASLDCVLLFMNPAGRKLIGLGRTEDVATTLLSDFMPAVIWDWMRQGVLPIVMREGRWEGECQMVNVATGNVHHMQASFFLIRNPVSGDPMCLATVQRDITDQKWLDVQLQQNLVLVQEQNVELEHQRKELESVNAHLEALATTDGLTGAKNHRAFQEKLMKEFKRVERTHRPFSVILLDVDKFKQYNDQFGHPEGDRVLKRVVQALQETAREMDFVARYGGEEFVVLLPETSAEGAIEAAERFRTAIEAQDWPLRPVTASFGVATLSATTEIGQQLVDMADKALYASKEAGRNRTTHYDHTHDHNVFVSSE